jgi:glutathione synthase/RimK-type ligase-like ATP-grasp enzyme
VPGAGITRQDLLRSPVLLGRWDSVIVKPPYGNGAMDVLQLSAREVPDRSRPALGRRSEILTWNLLSRYGSLCAQPMLARREVRLLAVGGEICAAFQYTTLPPAEDAPRGVARQVDIRPVEPTAELREISHTATAALNLPLASLDLIDTAHGPVVLEVNPSLSGWLHQEGSSLDWTRRGVGYAIADALMALRSEIPSIHPHVRPVSDRGGMA